ncbi:MAG: polysaccharide deacetylase family protein [Clostridia bacterium]
MKRTYGKKKNKKKIYIMNFAVFVAIILSAIFFIISNYKKPSTIEDEPINEPTISSSSDIVNSDVVLSPSAIPNIKEGFDANVSGVPVVMYHNLMEDDKKANHPSLNNGLTATTSEFEKHLAALRERNYSSLSLEDLVDYMKNGTEIPYKSIMLTFDDGYLSNTELAAPLLRKYGFKAVMFVITEGIDGESQPYNSDILQYVTREDMQKASDVFTYASHANTLDGHNNYKNLTHKQYIKELDDGLSMLKSDFIAYPLGFNTSTIIKEVKARNYKCAFTIQNGYAKKNGDLYKIPRLYANSPMSAKKFIKLIETGEKQ